MAFASERDESGGEEGRRVVILVSLYPMTDLIHPGEVVE